MAAIALHTSLYSPIYRTSTPVYCNQTKVLKYPKMLEKVSSMQNVVEILTVLKTFNTIKEEQLFVWERGEIWYVNTRNRIIQNHS